MESQPMSEFKQFIDQLKGFKQQPSQEEMNDMRQVLDGLIQKKKRDPTKYKEAFEKNAEQRLANLALSREKKLHYSKLKKEQPDSDEYKAYVEKKQQKKAKKANKNE